MAFLSKSIDIYTTKCNNLLLLGDFNALLEDALIKIFCVAHSLISMTNKTYMLQGSWKTVMHLSNSDMYAFFSKFSCYRDIGLSDFHKIVTTVTKKNL